MNKIIVLCLLFISFFSKSQSFAPAPGNPGSTAIPKDSSCFIAWATGGTIKRGYIDINDTTATADSSNRASFGTLNLAFGPAQGNATHCVSLGDSGVITLSFDFVIRDEIGYDFAVFENGFMDHYMEFAHVEVSSDGVHFFRFPSTSEIPLSPQLSNASTSDCGFVNNLAGKYRAGFGTPFDVAELPDSPDLDKNQIIHVRLIDAIGAVSGTNVTTDGFGTVINDPYPTPFPSSGFDLDAVGIIHGTLGINDPLKEIGVYPNPTYNQVTVPINEPGVLILSTLDGKLVTSQVVFSKTTIDFDALSVSKGTYLLRLETAHGVQQTRIVFQ